MAVIEEPSEEECYLYAILSDESGLDLAEFVWKDDDSPNGCWRAWPFQWKWFRCTDTHQLDQCGRAVGKSLSIRMRAFIFPHIHPGQEMLLTAPEGNHLDHITALVENTFLDSTIGREMIWKKRGGQGIRHRPFEMSFSNGAMIKGRIPQRDGRGVKGAHPLWLEQDEAQDYPKDGWTELVPTLKTGFDGAVWRAHGVTRGMRDDFYSRSQPGSGWTIHRFSGMHRPTWTDAERQQNIKEYGAKDSPDYRRNILGLHGDATNPLFVLHRLMQCVDHEQESEFNAKEYLNLRVVTEELDEGSPIEALLPLNSAHLKYKTFWAGMDIGFTDSPSEILVFAEVQPWRQKMQPKSGRGKKTIPTAEGEDSNVLKLLTRIHLKRISTPGQVRAIMHVINFYKPKAFSLDKTGAGLPIFQMIQEESYEAAEIIKGYNFSEKILVDFDSTIEIDEYKGDLVKDAGIARNVLEWSSDKLRELVDKERIWLPWDEDLIKQFQGTTWTTNKAGQDMYGRRKTYSKGNVHALDATRMAVLGYLQHPIEEFTKPDQFEMITPIFFT